jgi:hypothetical protein
MVSTSAPMTPKFKRWLMRAHRKLEDIKTINAGRNVKIESGPTSITIHAEVPQAPSVARSPMTVAEDYPFKAKLTSDGGVVILGYNNDEGRYFKNFVTLGLTRLEVAEKTFAAISSDTWIYLEITYSSGYNVELKSSSTLPEQTATVYIIPIAFIKTADGKPSKAVQIQYGVIEGAGRIF